jgi:signal transduction histidine kinase
VGTLLLGAPRGADRLDRHHRRVLAEVLPFVVLVLRARAEADELRAARTAAATAREDERRRLRRDLHDGVGPLLAGQLLALDTMRVTGNRPELLAHLEAQTRSAIGEVRRVAHDLRPALLDAGGLPAALDSEAERLRVAGLPVRLGVDLSGVTLPAAAEVAVLRIAQEALANVVRHADASTAQVTVVVADGGLELVVADDGRGRGANPDGVGSVSMVERTQELGGTVTIEPGPHGGTVVRARIPLPLPAAGPA